MKKFKLVLLLAAYLSVASCGGGGDKAPYEELTPIYVASRIVDSFAGAYVYALAGYAHTDGLRNDNTIDLDRIIVAKAEAPAPGSELSFGWAYSIDLPASPPADLYVVFYIDTDGGTTGEPIDGILADKLFMTNAAFNYAMSAPYTAHWTWNGATWVAATGTEENYNDFFGIPPDASYVKGINVYYDNNIINIFDLIGIKGVVKVLSIPTDDPNDVNMLVDTIDSTAVFTFDTPPL